MKRLLSLLLAAAIAWCGQVSAADVFNILDQPPVRVGAPISGGTANRVLYACGSPVLVCDSASLVYDDSTKRLTAGLAGTDAVAIGGTDVAPSAGTINLYGITDQLAIRNQYGRALIGIGGVGNTAISTSGAAGYISIQPGGVVDKFAFLGTAGAGLSITAGTATTNVVALSVTRTNNDAAVATGVKFAFTDTTSAAGFLPFQVLGGASGTTNLFSLTKAGTAKFAQNLDVGDSSSSTVATGRFDVSGNIYSVSGGNWQWVSSSTNVLGGTSDTNLSRISAGVVGVGTGAAGSVAGQLHAGMLQASLGTALTLTQGAIGMSKMTASGSAPGATGLKLEVVCGTNAGSAKITALAGTSTTAVTVLDNIGSGVTGC